MPITIAFEGLDGSGTTTASKLLVEKLNERGISKVKRLFQPTQGHVGTLIKKLLCNGDMKDLDSFAQAMLFTTDRYIQWMEEIKPLINDHYMVVLDRCAISTLVYQNDAFSLPYNYSDLLNIGSNRFEAIPNIIFYIHISANECLNRIQKRGEPLEYFETKEKLNDLYTKYQEVVSYLSCNGQARIVTVDGTLSPDAIVDVVIEKLEKIYKEQNMEFKDF